MIALILMGLVKVNLAMAAAILAVLALRTAMRPRFGAQASYLMWLAPLVAGLAVLAPHPAARALIAPVAPAATAAVDAFVATASASVSAGPDLTSVVFGLWVAGALAAAALLLRRQAAFLSAMGRLQAMDGSGVFRAEHPGVGPAVVGVLRPRIVAPADFETRFGAKERELILAHERVHLRRGDAAVNAIACAAQCLCWFNPLAHLAARLLRIDQELACDATVIGRFPAERRTYAELLLKTQLAAQPLPLGCHWPAGAEHPLKARIAMLKSPLPARAMRGLGVAVAAAITLGAGAMAWAAQPGAAAAPGAGPGPAERAWAVKQTAAAKPNYTCDPALEAKGVGCKIVRTSTWLALPTPADVARYYPPGAREAGQTAAVQVTCKVTPKGLLRACEVQHVNLHVPPGEGGTQAMMDSFGDAALHLTRYYQANIPSLPNVPVREGSGTFMVEIGEFKGVVTPVGDMPPPSARAKTPVRYAPSSYTPPAGFAPPRTNGQAAPAAPFHSMWIKKPTGEDFMRLYPAEAVANRLTGEVTMSCKVGADGRLSGCAILRAKASGGSGPAPADDAGFGAATLELSKLFQMEATNPQGAPTGGTEIRIPVRFVLPRGPQPVAPS